MDNTVLKSSFSKKKQENIVKRVYAGQIKNIFIKHEPTDASIPLDLTMYFSKDNSEEVTLSKFEKKYDRRYFTLDMLSKRWGFCVEDIMKLLEKYDIHVYSRVSSVKDGALAPSDLFVFEEYILGVEKMHRMKHKKIKSKLLRQPK